MWSRRGCRCRAPTAHGSTAASPMRLQPHTDRRASVLFTKGSSQLFSVRPPTAACGACRGHDARVPLLQPALRSSLTVAVPCSYGLYVPMREVLGVRDAGGAGAFWKRVAAGAGAGALAAFVANPTDLIKVRMQVDGMKVGEIPRYRGLGHAFASIVRAEGLFGLWKGATPTLARATALAAVEMSSYDEIKRHLIQHNIIDPKTTSGVFVTAMACGLTCVIFTTPFDVVRSRVMGQRIVNGKPLLYSGMIDCVVKSVKHEGVLSLWKGFLPNWSRIGPRALIIWVLIEKLHEWNRRFGAL
eukprot:m.93332 g.93332  ORF g.93332 m.93332 type:complete len:300 (-) comp8681_c0_seq1:103-1002(-)